MENIAVISIDPDFYFQGYDKQSNVKITEDIRSAKLYVLNDYEEDDDADENQMIKNLNLQLYIDLNFLKSLNFKAEVILND